MQDAIKLRFFKGTQTAIKALRAGNDEASAIPMRIRHPIKPVLPPQDTIQGVVSVMIDVKRILSPRIYFPPKRSARIPPGICIRK